MKISIASDHAGFDQKEHMKAYLESNGYEVVDRGPYCDARVDYPDFAVLVANDVGGDAADRGVLFCGTGIGMAMAADKVCGVRAAPIINEEFAALAREHNDANVIALSARFVDKEENERIVDVFLKTPFGGGRHKARVDKINALDMC